MPQFIISQSYQCGEFIIEILFTQVFKNKQLSIKCAEECDAYLSPTGDLTITHEAKTYNNLESKIYKLSEASEEKLSKGITNTFSSSDEELQKISLEELAKIPKCVGRLSSLSYGVAEQS